jgi:hypothetical protein
MLIEHVTIDYADGKITRQIDVETWDGIDLAENCGRLAA